MIGHEFVAQKELWHNLVEQATELAGQAGKTAESDSIAKLKILKQTEIRFWQALEAMQLMENCCLADWTAVITALVDFYVSQHKHREASYLLDQLTELYLKIKWDFSAVESWKNLARLLITVGDYKKAAEFIAAVTEKKAEYWQERSKAEMDDSDLEDLQIDKQLDSDTNNLTALSVLAEKMQQQLTACTSAADSIFSPVHKIVSEIVADDNQSVLNELEASHGITFSSVASQSNKAVQKLIKQLEN